MKRQRLCISLVQEICLPPRVSQSLPWLTFFAEYFSSFKAAFPPISGCWHSFWLRGRSASWLAASQEEMQGLVLVSQRAEPSLMKAQLWKLCAVWGVNHSTLENAHYYNRPVKARIWGGGTREIIQQVGHLPGTWWTQAQNPRIPYDPLSMARSNSWTLLAMVSKLKTILIMLLKEQDRGEGGRWNNKDKWDSWWCGARIELNRMSQTN